METPTLPFHSIAALAYATVNAKGSSEPVVIEGRRTTDLTLDGATRKERQADAEGRIVRCCAILNWDASASLEEYRSELATWAPE